MDAFSLVAILRVKDCESLNGAMLCLEKDPRISRQWHADVGVNANVWGGRNIAYVCFSRNMNALFMHSDDMCN
jgi:hypothetical protein